MSIKNAAKRMLQRGFRLGQRCGFDILPRHFYSEIPDFRRLQADGSWRNPYSMRCVNGTNCDEQFAWVVDGLEKAKAAGYSPRRSTWEDACRLQGAAGYGPVEAQMLAAFVAAHQPPSVLQIGCGVSTAVLLENATAPVDVTCVEPYPSEYLQHAAVTLVPEMVQDVADMEERVSQLAPGSLFFVDGSHTLGPAGEASRVILELLPLVPDDCFVHFHDIWWPYDFQRSLLNNLFFWHESVLLHAFVAGNNRFRIAASMSMLHHDRPSDLAALFDGYRPCKIERGLEVEPGEFPTSTYLTTHG